MPSECDSPDWHKAQDDYKWKIFIKEPTCFTFECQ